MKAVSKRQAIERRTGIDDRIDIIDGKVETSRRNQFDVAGKKKKRIRFSVIMRETEILEKNKFDVDGKNEERVDKIECNNEGKRRYETGISLM